MKQMFFRLQDVFEAFVSAIAELLDRHGLARQSRLTEEQVLRDQKANVGRESCPGRKKDHIARNESEIGISFFSKSREASSRRIRIRGLARDRRIRAHHRFQSFGSAVESEFLEKGQADAHQLPSRP